ncbi:MAG: integrin alpha [Planctomycetota bacterium]
MRRTRAEEETGSREVASLRWGAVVVAVAAWTASPALSQARLFPDLAGIYAGDRCGSSSACLGDVTGDGVADIAVGSPTASPGGLGSAGQVLVFSGADGTFVYAVDGTTAGDGLGSSLAPIGELDGDTTPDFLAGAPDAAPAGAASGRIYLVSGVGGSILRILDGTQPGGRLGESLAGLDDINADSVPDLVSGAPGFDFGGNSAAGAVFAFSGADGDILYSIGGAASLDNCGRSVAVVADVDSDGFRDFLAGAPGYDAGSLSGTGLMLVCSGLTGAEIMRFEGPNEGDTVGTAVAAVGDVNEDTFEDYVAGAQGASTGSYLYNGSALLISGSHMSVIWRFDGEGHFHGLGKSAAAADDANADGIPDVLAGAPDSRAGGLSGQGSAYLLSGSDGSLIYRIDGPVAGAGLGASLTGLGDLDGDGAPEYGIGAPLYLEGACQVRRSQIPAFAFEGTGVIGSPLSLTLLSNALHEYIFVYDTDPGPTDTPLGRFFIGFSPYFGFIAGLFLDSAGHSVVTSSIPDDPALIGITLYGQCLVLTPLSFNGAFLLSNGDGITFQ